MNVLNLFKPTESPEPAADAWIAHQQLSAAKRNEFRGLQLSDTEQSATINDELVATGLHVAAKERLIDAHCAKAEAADIAAAEREVDLAALAAERLHIPAQAAMKRRGQLKSQMDTLRSHLAKLDAATPRLQHQVLVERMVNSAGEYSRAQSAFLATWSKMFGLCLAADRVAPQALLGPLGSRDSVAALMLPLPDVTEVRAVEARRDDLMQAIHRAADVAEQELAK